MHLSGIRLGIQWSALLKDEIRASEPLERIAVAGALFGLD